MGVRAQGWSRLTQEPAPLCTGPRRVSMLFPGTEDKRALPQVGRAGLPPPSFTPWGSVGEKESAEAFWAHAMLPGTESILNK